MGERGRRIGSLGWAAVFWAATCWAQASSIGQWGPVQDWPVPAVHAHLLPTGKVLFSTEFARGGDPPYLWDPTTDTLEQLPAPPYNIFCAAHVFWPDGRLFIMGGHISDDHGLRYTVLFNPYTKTWAKSADMNAGRWYPNGTVLHNGDVLVMSGNTEGGTSNTTPQVFELSNNRWRTLTGASGIYVGYYPRNFALPNGKIIMVGQGPLARWLDPNGSGTWVASQTTSYGSGRPYGTAVQYLPGKILLVGGATNNAEVIDANQSSPRFRQVHPMSFQRKQQVASLLPDGKVLVVGGHYGTVLDSPTQGVYTPELWDPDTESWTSMAQQGAYRGYHSTVVLLPDGRVLSAGSKTVHTMQVYSPSYLFKGSRPVISDAPSSIQYNQPFTVDTSQADGIAKVTLVRMASVTHAFDMNQRFNSLTFEHGDGQLTVSPPSSDYLAPPGYYMLFLLNGSGVPSVAKIVQLSGSGGTPPPPPPPPPPSVDAGTPPPPTADAGTPPPPPPTGSTFSDEFNRTQSSGIGNGWTTPLGRWLVNNQAISDQSVPSLAVAPVTCSNCAVESRLVSFKVPYAGLSLRVQAGSYDRYEAVVLSTGALEVRRVRGGVTTSLGTAASGIPDLSSWATLSATISGSGPVSIVVRVNGVDRLTVSDTAGSAVVSSGGAGLVTNHAGVPFDSFKVVGVTGSVPPPSTADAGTPPPTGSQFVDNFDRPNSSTLGANWVIRSGAWILSNNKAQSDRSTLNLALETKVRCQDCTAQAQLVTFGVPAAGLVLRSSDDGTNYYDAVLTSGGKIQIRRRQGATVVVLGEAPHGISNVGNWTTLTFAASGNTLIAKVNGVIKVTVTDGVLSAAGLAGLATTSAGVPVDNFSVQ